MFIILFVYLASLVVNVASLPTVQSKSKESFRFPNRDVDAVPNTHTHSLTSIALPVVSGPAPNTESQLDRLYSRNHYRASLAHNTAANAHGQAVAVYRTAALASLIQFQAVHANKHSRTQEHHQDLATAHMNYHLHGTPLPPHLQNAHASEAAAVESTEKAHNSMRLSGATNKRARLNGKVFLAHKKAYATSRAAADAHHRASAAHYAVAAHHLSINNPAQAIGSNRKAAEHNRNAAQHQVDAQQHHYLASHPVPASYHDIAHEVEAKERIHAARASASRAQTSSIRAGISHANAHLQ